MCEEVTQISKFEIRRGERERDREMPEHLCLQCFHCHMFQVIQMKKSNKWKCKVCHAKQSRRRVFARSDRAKDVRGVVQHMNMKIGEEEVRNRLKICVQYRFFLTLFFISILNQAARKRDEEEWSSKRSREDFEEEHTFNKRRRGEDYERDDRYVQEEQGMYYDDDDYELEYNSSTMPSHMRDLFEESSTTTTTKRKNSMDSSRERKKKKKTKKKKNNDNPLSKYLDMDQDKLNELYDVSMAYCGKCEEGGDMFCCSGCPGVYHPKCVGLDSVRRLLLTLSCVIIPTHRPIDTKKYRYPKMIGTVIGVNRQNRTFETSRTSRNSRTRNDACES